ncbi:MAG: radical SAM protein [Methanocalculus sp. MSAO_Arc1]|uniref:tetraether lipid synthase Tes n=1 Tax=Methanocalculus TaxID=71151 RepID=UPI000FF3E839|nr:MULTISPECIES: radical SAM protein [unclassified Methanocalculus]MCP1662835.1 putative radical SAM superfamily Fe-S cluster-containing enzyme [Methanocalculus sp. AMF5]RQD79016.1 MAG: radical SAM protein [Methanocalculus sp. MSAO_Arc1]
MILRKTKSICPICNSVTDADLTEEENRIYISRTCPDHGQFKALYWSDAAMFRRFDAYNAIGKGVDNSMTPEERRGCPSDCGLCDQHTSGTLLANLDVTNRCNLNCEFCFANARACGFVYEPTFAQIEEMFTTLRSEKPIPPPAIQLSGGEPTMREDLPAIVRRAKEVGFKLVQVATNGIRLAQDETLAGKLKIAGVSTIYLHFDGVTKETNPLLEINKKAIENCRRDRVGMVLVPTIIRGKNDHEAGAIIRFAADNIDVIRGVNFQPVAFTGAASHDEIDAERITIPDLLHGIEDQTAGILKSDDFYPIPCVGPIIDLVESYTGKPQIQFTAHPHCGAATYIFVTEKGLVPVNRLVDVEQFFRSIDSVATGLRKGGTLNKYRTLLEGVNNLRNTLKQNNAYKIDFHGLIANALIHQNFDALREFHWNALFVGTMHFMDNYNYDLDRVRRCCIHYATPDGRIIPFCAYNSGNIWREEVWKKHALTTDSEQAAD